MKFKVALFPGDGVGPELISEGLKVISRAAELDKFEIEWAEYPHGSEHYQETKELLPEKILKEIKSSCSAIYCGTFNGIKDDSGSSVNIPSIIRDYFGQFAVLRPIKLLPTIDCPLSEKSSSEINFVILREGTEDFYAGASGRAKSGKSRSQLSIGSGAFKSSFGISAESKNEIAYQIGVLSRKGCERIAKYAFEYAKKSGIKKITFVDKANLLHCYDLWRESIEKTSKEYGTECEFELIDSASLNLLRQPEKYSLIVAPNMFGDILGSIGIALQGGIAFGARGSINPEGISMFEPIHGSAPKLKGQGIVSPIAAVWAGALMLDAIGQQKSGELIIKAIEAVLKEGRTRTQDLGGNNSTSEMGGAIADKFVELHD